MDQKNISTLLVAGFIAAVIGFVAGTFAFKSAGNHNMQAPVVPSISSDFPTTDLNKYFTNNSIDPTQLVKIGNNNNPSPFSGASNSLTQG